MLSMQKFDHFLALLLVQDFLVNVLEGPTPERERGGGEINNNCFFLLHNLETIIPYVHYVAIRKIYETKRGHSCESLMVQILRTLMISIT